MQLVPAVTELVISELLWLNFSAPEKPVYVYLHSIGSQTPDGQAVGFDTEAYAILDTLAYIRPEIHTLALGQVTPCMHSLYSSRHCLESASSPYQECRMLVFHIMTCPEHTWDRKAHADVLQMCLVQRLSNRIRSLSTRPQLCGVSGPTACAVQAFGNAAMILASGKKGNRFALPHSRIMTAPPRINRSFGSTSNIMIKANELEYNTQTYVDFLSGYTGGCQSKPVRCSWSSSRLTLLCSMQRISVHRDRDLYNSSVSYCSVWHTDCSRPGGRSPHDMRTIPTQLKRSCAMQDVTSRRCGKMWDATGTSHQSRPLSECPTPSSRQHS